MKLTEAKCRITGVTLGEAQINLIRIDAVPIQAKFALISGDGSVSGYFERRNGWSDKVLQALQAFVDAIEEDGLTVVFEEMTKPVSEGESAEGPPQF